MNETFNERYILDYHFNSFVAQKHEESLESSPPENYFEMVCFIKITRGNKIFTKFHLISCKLNKSKYLNKMRKSTSLVARFLFPTPKKSAQFRVYVFKLKRKPIKSDSRIPSRNRRDFLLLIHPLTKSMCVQRNFFHVSFRHSACLSPNATSERYTIKSLTNTINPFGKF